MSDIPDAADLTERDWEMAEYVYRFLRPGSDGERSHPDVRKAAQIVAKIRLRHSER